MQAAGLPATAIASFRLHIERVVEGERGLLAEDEIEGIETLSDSEAMAAFGDVGRETMSRTVVIKLNGGLGTSMGLERAKSLLPVRDGLTFLDLIARQMLCLRDTIGADVPLMVMNSFRTRAESEKALRAYPDLAVNGLPLSFLQSRVPKVMAENLTPAAGIGEFELAWCPPGHGDLYTSIANSGALERLLDFGVEYAFVSNADNLGAVPDPEILGYMVDRGADFLLEAADRTPADRKGGHLCRLADGRMALRESAQCPAGSSSAFQDIDRHRYFNTNNLWLHLPSLAEQLEKHGGFLPLPTIVNPKNLDPRDPGSPSVLQLETVMGTAISHFPRAAAVRVPRSRFSPVKNTNDLLGVRSDAFDLTGDSRIVLAADRTHPPLILLDERFFKFIDAFEERFPSGPPSLHRCKSLMVEGNVTFGKDVTVEGDAVVRTKGGAARIPDGTEIHGNLEL